MALPLYVPIFTFSSIAIDVLIILLILRQREQVNLRMNWYLILMIITITMWIGSVFLQEAMFPYFTGDPANPTNIANILPFTVLAAFSNIAIVMGLLLLSVFIKYLVQPELELSQTSYLISLVVLITGIYAIILLGALQEDEDLVELAFNFANLINLIMVISVLIYARRDIKLLRTSIINASDKVKRQVTFLNIGLNLALLGIIPLLVIANFFVREAIAFSFVLLTISLALIAYAYQLDPRVVYILPERTHQAIVVNSNGVLRYSTNFKGEADEASTVLISGALIAITSLMREFYESVVYPTMIKFQDQNILFKWNPDYFLAVFSDRDTKLIREAMESSVRDINKRYGGEITEAMNGSELLKLDDIFNKAFYFVYT